MNEMENKRHWIVDRLFEEMKTRHWSQTDMANAAQISQGTLSDWWTGKAKPSYKYIEACAQAMQMTVSDLVANGKYVSDLNESQEELFTKWVQLNEEQKEGFHLCVMGTAKKEKKKLLDQFRPQHK